MNLVQTHGWWTSIFWIAFGVFLALLLCALLCWYRRSSHSIPDQPPRWDQLDGIEGIGPSISKLLLENGITTFRALSETSVASLRNILDKAGPNVVGVADPASWPSQARLLAAGNIEGFLRLAQKLDVGRVPLEAIAGIGRKSPFKNLSLSPTGELLRHDDVDINSVEVLARQDAPHLLDRLRKVEGEAYSLSEVEKWIEQAKRFEEGNVDEYLSLAGTKQFEPILPVGTSARPIPLGDTSAGLRSERVETAPRISGGTGCDICAWLAALLALLLLFLALLWILGVRPLVCDECPVSRECKPPLCEAGQQCMVPPLTPLPCPTSPPVKLSFSEITFRFDGFSEGDITYEGKGALRQLERVLTAYPPTKVVLSGTADRSGKVFNHDRNVFLSRARTETVADILKRNLGVPESIIVRQPIESEATSPVTERCKLDSRGRARNGKDQWCLLPDRRVDVDVTLGPAASAPR